MYYNEKNNVVTAVELYQKELQLLDFNIIANLIEGHIIGFDEYMNLVLDEAAEVHLKRGTMKRVGRIMLKGDNITLIQSKDGN